MAACHETFRNFLSLFIVFLLLFIVGIVGEVCEKVTGSLCACQNSKGKIDLSKLSEKVASPRWKDLPSLNDKYLYSYDPCKPFTESPPPPLGGCTGVLACQITADFKAYNPVADDNKDDWTVITDEITDLITFQYQALSTGAKPFFRKLFVELHCADEEARLVVLGEEEKDKPEYRMKLYSREACFNGVFGGGGISFGSILVILFFVGLIVYFVGGFLFLTYVRHAQGMERVPNLEFWRDFPHLVRDGTLFVFNGCKVETSYDRI